MEWIQAVLDWLRDFWGVPLFNLGETPFTIGSILYLFVALTLLVLVTSFIKRILIYKILARYNLDIGVSQSIGTITRYLLMALGFVIIFQSTGIDLSVLGFLIGALGIGIGFGLQNITTNLISGIIILLERPVKVGDRIEVGSLSGNIVKIASRATTIITNDNIAVIVPNSEFINARVVNWSLHDRNIRFNFPVGVSYKEDPNQVRKLLLEVAKTIPGVLKKPAPDVLFEDYGDSSLNFNLRVWTSDYSNRKGVLKSKLYFAIFDKFKEHGIEIPFPQRDVHIKEFPESNQNKTTAVAV